MTDNPRIPPHDVDAEESLVGAMMLTRDAVAVGLDLPRDAWYVPANRLIAVAIGSLWAKGSAIDPVTVAAALGDAGVAKIGGKGELLRLQASTPASANAPHYARIIAEHARAREAIALGDRLRDAGYSRDLDAIHDLADQAVAGLAREQEHVEARELDDLLADVELEDDKPWLIPGTFRQRERLLLTGGEGWGKMTLLRQIGLALASGLHPFTGLSANMPPPCPVLIVDLQEDIQDLRAEMGKLRAKAADFYQPGMLHAISRSQGMNLLSAADQRWLEGAISTHRPALVIIGPLRKLSRTAGERQSKNSEDVVDELTRILDDLRVRYDFALAMEGHAGHDRDQMRMRGSSVWLDWPEFGHGMKGIRSNPREVEIVKWRGDRHTGRLWPRKLHGGQGWPWKPGSGDYEKILRGMGLDDLIDGGPDLLDILEDER